MRPPQIFRVWGPNHYSIGNFRALSTARLPEVWIIIWAAFYRILYVSQKVHVKERRDNELTWKCAWMYANKNAPTKKKCHISLPHPPLQMLRWGRMSGVSRDWWVVLKIVLFGRTSSWEWKWMKFGWLFHYILNLNG